MATFVVLCNNFLTHILFWFCSSCLRSWRPAILLNYSSCSIFPNSSMLLCTYIKLKSLTRSFSFVKLAFPPCFWFLYHSLYAHWLLHIPHWTTHLHLSTSGERHDQFLTLRALLYNYNPYHLLPDPVVQLTQSSRLAPSFAVLLPV